jgi:diguanylate cyclase (GGDEF)-like protein
MHVTEDTDVGTKLEQPETFLARSQALSKTMRFTASATAFTVPAAIATVLATGTPFQNRLAMLFLAASVALTIATTLTTRRFTAHADEFGLGDNDLPQTMAGSIEQSRSLSTWETVHAVIMAATGCLWALPMWFSKPATETVSPLIFSVGAAAVCLAICAPAKKSYLTFMIFLMSQSVAGLVLEGGHRLRLIPAALMFGFIMILMSAMIADAFSETFVTRSRHENITESLLQSNQQLAHEAFHDRLTGLANRARVLEMAERHLVRAREDNSHVGVVFIDLDRFKVVNDTFGHPIGDQVLIEVARRLEHAMRPGDVIGRLGGDEFVGVLPQVPDARIALDVAARISAALAEAIVIDGNELHVGACIGVTLGSHKDDANELIRQADVALYRAKVAGRGRIEMFDEQLRDMVEQRIALEQTIRKAISRDDIIPWYQPLIEIATGRVVGVEMLARWIDLDSGMKEAAAFMDVATETGLIDELGPKLIERAMKDATHWMRSGATQPGFVTTINLSRREITKPGGLDTIIEAFRSGTAEAKWFSFEVREPSSKDDVRTIANQLGILRKLGASITLDNFGSDTGSLSLLRYLPLNAVKIDGQLVRKAQVDPASASSLKAAVSAAREMGLRTFVSGIETDQQLDSVRTLGVTVAQGRLWSGALPATSIADYVDAREYVAQTLKGLL